MSYMATSLISETIWQIKTKFSNVSRMERRMYFQLSKIENINFCIKFEDIRPMRLEDISIYQSGRRHFKRRIMVTLQFS